MSILHFFNFFIFQWFFFRVFKRIDEKADGWGIMYPVLPITGYWDIPYFPYIVRSHIFVRIRK